MSRIGKLPVPIPSGVKLELAADQVKVNGPKGSLTCPVAEGITCRQDGDKLVVERRNDSRQQRAFHGLTRALIANAVRGTTQGYQRELEIRGVGYRAEVKKDSVEFALGYSHPVIFPIPEGISVQVEKQTRITVTGIDKQQVGQVAANIRALRPPEPYKGKGVRYSGEHIRRKAGKSGATAAK